MVGALYAFSRYTGCLRANHKLPSQCAERDHDERGSDTDADGRPAGAETGVHDEPASTLGVEPERPLLSEPGEVYVPREEGQRDLSAVRVTTQHEVDATCGGLGKVDGIVREEDDWFAR